MENLSKPARYTPFSKGVYEVAANLRPFATDFGNGELDKKVFQIDSDVARYLKNKDDCRTEDIKKYCLFHKYSKEVQKTINQFIAERLAIEYPELFQLEKTKEGFTFRSNLREESFSLSSDFELTSSNTRYLNAFDALCSQVPEDLAVISVSNNPPSNVLSAIHLCAAGHWSPASKIGKDFFNIHTPVAEIQKINERAQQFAEIMVQKGPFVRFAWGFSTDTRLNHHPEAPHGVDPHVWHGRSFSDPLRDKLYVRVERQVTWGFPQVNAALFTIRVSYMDGEEIKKDEALKNSLVSALKSMSPEVLSYKGLTDSLTAVLEYLK